MKKLVPLLVVAALICGSIIYLNPSGGADETRPIAEVQTEAESLDTDGLHEMAVKYKDALLAKRKDLEDLKVKIQEIPVTEAHEVPAGIAVCIYERGGMDSSMLPTR